MKIPIIYWPLEFTLKLGGFWPGQSNVLGCLLMISALVTLLPFQFWDALHLFDTPLILMDSFSDILREIILYVKLFVMWSKRRLIKDLLKEIADEYKSNTFSERWPKLHTYAHKFCKYDYGWYLGSTLLYYAQLISIYITEPVEDRLMLLKSYYPFDYKRSPYFELLNLTQMVQGWTMTLIYTMSETFLVTLILYTSGHVEALRDQIKLFSQACQEDTVGDVINHENCRHLIVSILKQHLKVLNLVKDVDTLYSYISLTQLFFSSLTICVTGFVVILALQHKDVILLVKCAILLMLILLQAFTFCYAGQYLSDKNEEVAAALYDSCWYNIESKEVRSIVFILKKMQVPLELTAGKFATLSTQSFSAIVKSSFSYLSVLRAAYV